MMDFCCCGFYVSVADAMIMLLMMLFDDDADDMLCIRC
jgi:hypothetical protein